MKHTFWLTAGGLIGALGAFALALVVLRDNADVAKLLPAVLGAVFTVIGTILGHMQGGATGRAEASKVRKDADSLRLQLRTYEAALPEATAKVQIENREAFSR